MKTVLYLHGFASGPMGRKVTALREILGPKGFRLVAPDLNAPSFRRLDFQAMVQIAVWESKVHRPVVVVGSSLGALVALAASPRGVAAPLLLIAPAIGFGSRWTAKLPADDPLTFFHYAQGRDLPIHRAFFERLASLTVDRDPPTRPVTLIMGAADESVPPEIVQETWRRWEESGRLAEGSRYIEIPQGDHGLVDAVSRIAEEIVASSGASAR
ncbi:MAG: YqiA/YcfP family alpha/beta fold hydrolase [Thermoanaerobaculia bacterium]